MLRSSYVALSALALFGCSESSLSEDDAGAPDALAALEQDTGHPWTVRYHADLHTPAYLQGRTDPLAATAADAERAGRAFLARYRSLYRMSSPDAELAHLDSLTDELGMTHARFAQRVDSIRVWGDDLILHFDPSGALVRINGRYQPLAPMSVVPTRSPDEARSAAVTDARAARPDVDLDLLVARAPKLWVYPTAADAARLAWRVETEVQDLARPMLLEIWVDATDGAILHRVDILARADGSGMGAFGDRKHFSVAERRGYFWLEDDSHGQPAQKIYSAAGRSWLPGAELKSQNADVWDDTGDGHGAAVDAQVYLAATWDYFAQIHGRLGWDGRGHGVHASVHFGKWFPGAFFDGRRLVFGDGDGDALAPLSAGLDVVAHEFTHGITFHSARLPMEGQSGALNEAVSDVFTAFVVHAANAGHEWRFGETINKPNGRGKAIRDAVQPHRSGNPQTMAEYLETDEDNGGVHLNSTIVSHAAYLMTGSPGALGWEGSARVWYRALTHYLTYRATFADAADATVAAAGDLGLDDQAVRTAWVAVGVLNE